MSEKNLDNKNRFRNRVVAFRMSEPEREALEKRWKLLGYRTKQDYLIDAVLVNQVNAVGNAEMMYQFRQVLTDILQELQRLSSAGEIDEELLTTVKMMLEIVESFRPKTRKEKKEEEAKGTREQYMQMMHLRKLQGMMRKEKEGAGNEQSHSDS